MASTFSTNLAIELIGTGDQAGTWGVTTNTNLGTLIEQAISGYVTQAVSTGADTTITIPNGATGVARNMYIELTGTGGTNTNLIVPSNKKLYFIFNNTSSGQVTVKVSGQTGVSVPNGKKMILVCNGTDVVNGLNYIADFGTNSFTVTNLTASSGTITNLIATTGTITTLSATSGNISNLVSSDASATVLRAGSATLTHLSATSASITNLALTSLTISSLSITNVSVASATVSSNLTLSGGTANGVLYLNGSKVATSGSALVFDGTNLGIGTSSPAYKLDVNGQARLGGTAGLFVGIGTAFSSGQAEAYTTSTTPMGIGTAGAAPLRFYTNSNFNAVLDTSGNLGLGVTPSAWGSGWAALQIKSGGMSLWSDGGDRSFFSTNLYYDGSNRRYVTNGEAAEYAQAGAAHIWSVAASGTAGNAISFTQAMTLDANGNLGIGTTSPATPLDVNKAGGGNFVATFQNTTSATPYCVWIKDASSGANGYPLLTVTNSAGTGVYFRIDSGTGNVGIGTGSPGEKLNVIGGNNTTSTVNFTGGSNNDNATIASDYSLVFQVDANNNVGGRVFNWRYGGNGYEGGTSLMTLNASGNLGLGVTPSAWSGATGLQVLNASLYAAGNIIGFSGNSYLADAGANDKYIANGTAVKYLGNVSGDHRWYVAASGTAGNAISFTQAMTLNASGQLSVGTTSANYRLRVASADNSGSTVISRFESANELQAVQIRFASVLGDGGDFTTGTSTNHNTIFYTNNTERARITAGGDLLVGTTTALGSAGSRGNVSINGSSSSILSLGVGSVIKGYVFHGGTDMQVFNAANGYVAFGTNDTERARITAGGDLLVGTTSAGAGIGFDTRLAVDGGAGEGSIIKTSAGVSAYCLRLWNSAATGNNLFAWFGTDSAGNSRGSITYDRTGNVVSYNTTSDARLKENIEEAADAGDKIDAIKVRQFDWKETGNHMDYGFIAQELNEVAPIAVTKPEDEEAMWSVDYSKLVPMLIKEVQSLRKRVAELEAK